jgi:hypothetical protein
MLRSTSAGKLAASFLVISALLGTASALAQSDRVIVPQIADGGGWKTTITFLNTSRTLEAPVEVQLFNQDGGELALPLAGMGRVAQFDRRLRPGAALTIETEGRDANASSGWAIVSSGGPAPEPGVPPTIAPVTVFTSFRFRQANRPDIESTVFSVPSATRELSFPHDNTGGFVSSYAVANNTGNPLHVKVLFSDEAGNQYLEDTITLPSWGQLAFESGSRFPFSRDRRGVITFMPTTAQGRLGAIGLRFNPTGPFVTLPSMTYR